MSNLAIDIVNVIDSSNIEVVFTSNLTATLNIGNVEIITQTLNTVNSEVLSVKVVGNKLNIICQPLTPYAVYNLIFKSTLSSAFTSLNGDSFLAEDGVSNIKLISGPPEPENVFRDLIRNFLRDNVYNIEDYNTIIGKLIESYSNNFIKCLNDVIQIKNENYITNLIENERKVRGNGPFDKLNENGAYEIVRVALSPSSEDNTGSNILWNYKGEFNSDLDYVEGDVVIYNGSTWYANATVSSHSGNPTNNNSWNLLGEAGIKSFDDPTGFGVSGSYQIGSFPKSIVSLQSDSIQKEILSIDSVDVVGKFNINNLILNLANDYVLKLNKVVFILNTNPFTYVYPIDIFGYQILDNKYDQEYGFNYFNLQTNQIKLNDVLLKSQLIDLQSINRIEVSYEYKDTGKIINSNTLSITNILTSSRETLPAIINVFDLKNAPIVNSNNVIPELDGVTFTDPNNINLSASHPAFLKEIPFRLEALPYLPGQYSVNYATGRVYVYGKDSANDGTGDYPPVATYKYRFQYQKDIDYSFDSDIKDLAALPNGNLINNKCRINFKYEKVLTPDVDYVARPHQESLSERIENRILDLGTIRTLNKPVTNVFRIYNETSGEIYTATRWSDDKVYYSYNIPPEIREITSERAKFEISSNELLFVNSILNNNLGIKIYKILLKNNNIISQTEDCIGSSFNSSVSFSKKSIFNIEKYFNKENLSPENLLKNIGEYCVDYLNGVIYCAVSVNQDQDLGFVSYSFGKIKTFFEGIISVDDIFNQVNPLLKKNKKFNYSSFENLYITPNNLEKSDEIYYQNNSNYPYQLLNNNIGFYDTLDERQVITVSVENTDLIAGVLYSTEDIVYPLDRLNINSSTFSSSISTVTYNPINNTVTIPSGTELNFASIGNVVFDSIRFTIYYSYYDIGFQNKVTDPIKDIRKVFEFEDLINNNYPINFANKSTYQERSVTVDNLSGSFYDIVYKDVDDNLYVYLPINSTYISPNLNFIISIKNINNNNQLWDANGQILADGKIKLILSGFNLPTEGDPIKIDYLIEINNLSRVMIDYDKGGLYIDYSILFDKLVISYEYGEDVIDFRKTKSISPGTSYYVTYKVGAMRDALLNNFGSLLNVKELNNFNIDLERENYRDCVSAALSSFLQGPTEAAIKNLVSKITHTNPEIVESMFNTWSLGDSLLYPNQIQSTGEFSLVPLKFNNGVLINKSDQSIYLPQSSNLSLKEGTFETWIMSEWDGIDNNSELTISITKNGVPISNDLIFVGLDERYPKLIANSFKISKKDCLFGIPQKNKNGVYVYYSSDPSNLFNRWYIEVIDNGINGSKYTIQISSAGKFYDLKSLNSLDSDISLTTLSNKVSIKVNNQINKYQAATFICDHDQYVFDTGESLEKNRMSLYKDSSGYLNFKIIDKNKNSYSISHDISSWKRNEKHFLSTSWKLNSDNGYDEMHLFIDGFEVPNNIKYSQKLLPYPHQKFKTLSPEIIIGSSDFDIVGGNDLSTTLDGYASSSISIGANNIEIGDIVYVDDPLFNTNGYPIEYVNGNIIKVSSFPAALQNLKFSINKTSFNLKLDAAIYSNVSVSTISVVYENVDLGTISGTSVVSSASSNFTNIKPGFVLRVLNSNFTDLYTILSVNGNNLTLDKNINLTLNNLTFYIYSNEETELPGKRSLNPHYQLSTDNNFNSVLTVTNGVFAKDILILNTYGLNFQKIKTKHYVWSNESNKIYARLPEPISTNSIKITKIIDSGFVSTGNYFNNNLDQPTVSDVGRDLVAVIYGSAADFSSPIKVTIIGEDASSNIVSQYVEFNDYGKLDFSQKITSITSLQIEGAGKFAFELREKFSITYNDSGSLFASVKCSYSLGYGSNLTKSSSNVATDINQYFSKLIIGNTLSIMTPFIQHFKILNVSDDGYSLTLDSTLPNFSSASYIVRHTSDSKSGIRNGQFYFEEANYPGIPYFINKGSYEIEYDSYLSIKMDPSSKENIYFGSDINGKNQINAAIDQVKIDSICLQDTRINDVILESQRTITKDFNSLKPLDPTRSTLLLIDFNNYPFSNKADFFVRKSSKEYIQSTNSINNYFNNSIVLKDKDLILENYGILDSRGEATIEFWVNSIYDIHNDPSFRYYFDAYGAKSTKIISLNNSQIILNENVSEILGVYLENGDPSIDYFAGGSVELSNTNAIQISFPISGSGESVTIPNEYPAAFQIISVRMENDIFNKNYFGNGVIDRNNKRTLYLENKINNFSSNKVIVTYKPANGSSVLNTQIINLNKKLPKDNSSVIVKFIPKGFKGDRISIFKDPLGYLNFKIFANNKMHSISYKINWSKNTWHRVKASFRANSKNNDEMRLFVDGFEVSEQLVQSRVRNNVATNMTISLKDIINEIHIGGDFASKNLGYCLINNFRISNISRPLYKPYGQSIDVAYGSNLNIVFPVTKDLYTTYLLDIDGDFIKNEDFTSIILKDSNNFNFGINIFDSFGIINQNPIIKQILEKLVKNLKPANSKVYLNYQQ